MSDFLTYPRQDRFETQLSQGISASDTACPVVTAPSITVTAPSKVYIGIDYDNNLYELCDGTIAAGVITLSTRGIATYEGGSGTARIHSSGAKVIITHSWKVFADIATALNGKIDDTGDTMTGALGFSGTTHPGIKPIRLTTAQRTALSLTGSDTAIVYDTDLGQYYIWQGGAWSAMASGSIQPNADTSTAGKVEIPTQTESDNGTAIGGTGASLASTPAVIAATAQKNSWKYAADGGASDSYAITLTPAPAAYVTGMEVDFIANTANTGAATLNVNGLGAVSMVKDIATALEDNDIRAGQHCKVRHNGTNFVLLNPFGNASTNARGLVRKATSAQVALGTATGANGETLVVCPDTVPNLYANYTAGESITAGQPVCIQRVRVPFTTGLTETASAMGDAAGRTRIGWKFTPRVNVTLNDLTIRMRTQGAPADNVTIEINADSAGSPSGASLGTSNNFAGGSMSGSFANRAFSWASGVSLTAGTTYWFVVRRSGANDVGNYYEISVCSSSQQDVRNYYSNSQRKLFDGAAWGSTDTAPIPFFTTDDDLGEEIMTTSATYFGRTWNFVGFAAETRSAGQTCKVTINGINGSQTSLTPGITYYLGTSFGTLSTTASGYLSNVFAYEVGIALSSTEILLKIGQKTFGGSLTLSSGVNRIWNGFRPRIIKVHGIGNGNGVISQGLVDGAGSNTVIYRALTGPTTTTNNTNCAYLDTGGGAAHQVVGQDFNDYGFNFQDTIGGAPGTGLLVYEVLG